MTLKEATMAHGLPAAAFLIALCAPAIARSAGVEALPPRAAA